MAAELAVTSKPLLVIGSRSFPPLGAFKCTWGGGDLGPMIIDVFDVHAACAASIATISEWMPWTASASISKGFGGVGSGGHVGFIDPYN